MSDVDPGNVPPPSYPNGRSKWIKLAVWVSIACMTLLVILFVIITQAACRGE